MSFKEMGLSDPILKSIEALGFESPTEVQKEAIPAVLNQEDLIVMAKTGSGKTGAFSLPIIEQITSEKHPQALILAPTRELAVQVEKDIQGLSKFTDVSSMAVYGQHSMNVEIEQLKKGKQIIVGTPGRVLHHITAKKLITKNIKYLVLDEADRMLDMGFIDQMIKILKHIPRDRVTLLFSATMPPEIQRMCKSYMKEPKTILLESDSKTVDTIEQKYFRVEHNEKRTQLKRLLQHKQPMSCMIFCNMRIEVDKVNAYLVRHGFLAEAIHGANTQSRRMRTIEDFKKGEIQILVATDVAARGIHIDDMELVINYDIPQDKDSYIHRIGRTGRAGNGGQALSLVTSDDIFTMYEIEEHVGAMIEEGDLPSDEEVEASLLTKTDHWDKKIQERQMKKAQVRQTQPKKKPSTHSTNKRSDHRSTTQKSNSHPKPQRTHVKSDVNKKPHQHQKSHNTPNHGEQTRVNKPTQSNKPVQHNKPVQSTKVPQQTQVVSTKAQTNITNEKRVEPKKKFSLKNLFKKKKS